MKMILFLLLLLVEDLSVSLQLSIYFFSFKLIHQIKRIFLLYFKVSVFVSKAVIYEPRGPWFDLLFLLTTRKTPESTFINVSPTNNFPKGIKKVRRNYVVE